MIGAGEPLAAVLGRHLDARGSRPSRRRTPRSPARRPGPTAVATPSSTVDDDAGGVDAAASARRAAATDASWNWVSASWLSGTHPRLARKVALVRLGQHRRDRRLPERPVVPLHLGHRRNVIRIVA